VGNQQLLDEKGQSEDCLFLCSRYAEISWNIWRCDVVIHVIYEGGVFRPVEPVDLPDGQLGTVTVDDGLRHREELKMILSDMHIRWSNPDDDTDAWVEDKADEIANAFKGLKPLSELIIEERGEQP
jgi:predicted DNA-binding antitoxin AbrB/MazE fold protein